MTVHLFSDPWYSSYIAQTLDGHEEDDNFLLAMSIMMAGAFVAQSIDNAFGEGRTENGYDGEGTVRDALNDIASGLDDVVSAIRKD